MGKEVLSGGRRRVEVKLYDLPSKDRNAPGALDVDFNERTTQPHRIVQEALTTYAKEGRHQIYPDYKGVNDILAKHVGVNSGELIPTNGSDDGIGLVARALLTSGDKVVIPEPTFSTLEDEPLRQRAEIVVPRPRYQGKNLDFPFDEVMSQIKSDEIILDETIPDKKLIAAIKSGEIIFRDGVFMKPGTKLVVVCNPNNPTGTSVPREQLEQIITKAADVGANVLVDEAYYEFSKFTVLDLIKKFDNLFITRTLSKAMGVADLRLGYVISQSANIDVLKRFQNPFAVNAFAVAAVKTLENPEVRGDIENYVSEVMKSSKPAIEDFYRKNHINFFPSETNFHLLQADKGLADFLKTKGIFVRVKESLPGMVRVSIGTKQDTEKYLSAVQEYLNASK